MARTVARNQPPARLRKAKLSDARQLAMLAGDLGYPTTTSEMRTRLRSTLPDPRHGVYVAVDKRVVGLIHLAVMQSLGTGTFVEIVGLIVSESHRGRSIGSQLVERGERWAVENGCNRMRVRTNVLRDEARAFYAKIGYTKKKTQEVFDKFLGAHLDWAREEGGH